MPASPLSDSGASWASPKRRRSRPSPMTCVNVNVGRESGASASMGTFGKADRFPQKLRTGHGMHSPFGKEFYGRNQLFKMPSEVGKQPSQGIGGRVPLVLKCAGPKVGPGSYEIIASAASTRSPLDGPDYCTATMKIKLPSSLVPKETCSPGPHHKYEIAKNLDAHCPNYPHKQKLAHGTRHLYSEDRDQPGPGDYEQHMKTVAHATLCPNFRSSRGSKSPGLENAVAGGTKKFVKSTFGVANRFGKDKKTCSPEGEMFYAHSKFLTSSDYLEDARSCGFGGGNKIDFANPMKLSSSQRLQVSPVTYHPVSSSAKRTSPFDGFAERCASPVQVGCRGLGSPKKSGSSPSLRGTLSTRGGGHGGKCMPRSGSEPALAASSSPASPSGAGAGAAEAAAGAGAAGDGS
eukprot:TRINITY_DN31403_c0_g1_i1.p1 TRINITY_DN31403_c0_g1~~TRINITY_DN31403_c0_g1_i1.p1  ORF type:complete len:440 (+),score=88.57 TRINITY_DN31403_c0_g1_i1:107-1321(+)